MRDENGQILDLLAELQAEDSQPSDLDSDYDLYGEEGEEDLDETFSFDGLLPPQAALVTTAGGAARRTQKRPELKIADGVKRTSGEPLPIHDQLPVVIARPDSLSPMTTSTSTAAISIISPHSFALPARGTGDLGRIRNGSFSNNDNNYNYNFPASQPHGPPLVSPINQAPPQPPQLPMDLPFADGEIVKLMKLGQLSPSVSPYIQYC